MNVFEKAFDISIKGNFEKMNILSERDNVKLNLNEKKELNEAKKILYDERCKRIKPFFDNKIQTDLNCYWFYSNLYASILINDNNIYNDTIRSAQIIFKKLDDKIYHCYNNDDKEVNVFLEDYCYYALLLITLYELESDKNYLNKCKELSDKIWVLFFNKENNFLQKNILNDNDLFVNPIDIADNNIPNGNSIYLTVCNKLKNITGDSMWKKKIDILSKSYHSYINFNFSQMFSYIRALNICESDLTVTLYGNYKNNKELLKKINLLCMEEATIIHKESEDVFFSVICKNQTCSEKLKSFDEISNFFFELKNVQ